VTNILISFEFWPAQRRGIAQRFAICSVAALLIGLALWAQHGVSHSLAIQWVYSFAITLSIWFLSDVGRMALFYRAGQLDWPSNAVKWLFSASAILLGYVIGTSIGDAYSGFSTFELIRYDLSRFARYLITAVLISLGFIGYFYQKERLANAQKQQAESHLRLLESQLEPHMLFNTLANLRALIQTDSTKAVSMLDALNGYLRATLGASRVAEHPLSQEFSRLEDYLALMKVRMGARLQYTLDCPAHLAAQPIPALLLQPLVENAIKHGLDSVIDGGALRVQAQRVGQQLLLTVSDTGAGLSAAQFAASTGFGLSHVRERLASRYGESASLRLVTHPGFATSLQIALPWTQQP
jgi:sensor histidine kinase YesM